MKKRVITGFLMGVVMLPILILGGWFMFGLAVILSYMATYELVKMHSEKRNLSKKYKFIIPLFSSMLVALGTFTYLLQDYFELNDLIFALIVIFSLLMVVSLFNGELHTTDILIFFGFILYAGLGIFLATSSRYITNINGEENKWFGLVLMSYVLLTTMFTDMGAYNFGLLLGKHKLCPTISPKKTIEGAIGGSLCGTIVGTLLLCLCEHYMNFNLLSISNSVLNVVVIGVITLVLTIFAQFGDLVASKLKREYEIKDYGFIFPGHGGVMDRFDSIIMTGTIFMVILIHIGVVVI